MTESRVCEYCGSELPMRNFALPGHRPMMVPVACDCAQSVAAREAERAEQERQEKIAAFSKAWERTQVPKMFAHVKADVAGSEPLLRNRSIYISGPNGRGKTHSACAIAKAYLARNTYRDTGMMRCWKSCLFVTAQDFFSRIRSSWDRWDENEEDVFMRYAGVGLLVLDDVGKGVPSEWAAENLFRLVNERWSNGRPMVITSQHRMTELSERYAKAGDETMAAMISRLGGWCDLMTLDGKDRRIA